MVVGEGGRRLVGEWEAEIQLQYGVMMVETFVSGCDLSPFFVRKQIRRNLDVGARRFFSARMKFSTRVGAGVPVPRCKGLSMGLQPPGSD